MQTFDPSQSTKKKDASRTDEHGTCAKKSERIETCGLTANRYTWLHKRPAGDHRLPSAILFNGPAYRPITTYAMTERYVPRHTSHTNQSEHKNNHGTSDEMRHPSSKLAWHIPCIAGPSNTLNVRSGYSSNNVERIRASKMLLSIPYRRRCRQTKYHSVQRQDSQPIDGKQYKIELALQ